MPPPVDRNHAVTVTCPHCGHAQADLLPRVGDRSNYDCPDCGQFSVSGTTERLVELGKADLKTARFLVGLDGRRFLREAR